MSELIPGKKYDHPEWAAGGPCTFIGMSPTGSLVFENPTGVVWKSLNTTGFEEVKEKKTKWLNIYPKDTVYYLYTSKEKADKLSASNRIACVEIEYYEGMGIDKT